MRISYQESEATMEGSGVELLGPCRVWSKGRAEGRRFIRRQNNSFMQHSWSWKSCAHCWVQGVSLYRVISPLQGSISQLCSGNSTFCLPKVEHNKENYVKDHKVLGYLEWWELWGAENRRKWWFSQKSVWKPLHGALKFRSGAIFNKMDGS